MPRPEPTSPPRDALNEVGTTAAADPRARPFRIAVTEEKLAWIAERVRSYPLHPTPSDEGDSWKYGVNTAWLQELCTFWLSSYRWRDAEADLNRYPQYRARVDGVDLHFVEVVGEAGGTRPLLLLHGWPGSFFEFWRVADQLAFPSKHGGSSQDAFDLVIPSLPGYAFSGAPDRPVGARRTAALMDTLMGALGYDRYMVQGGDQGAIIASWLGHDHAERCRALHVNLIGWRPTLDDDGAANDEERAFVRRMLLAEIPDMAYALQHWTKAQTTALALRDSPVGTAVWLLDKFHDWSDLRRRSLEDVYGKADLLTCVMIYLVSDAITSSLWSYPALLEDRAWFADRPYCGVPVAMAKFPREVVGFTPPRSWVERYYDIRRWTEFEEGGHFAALERPAELLTDVRVFARDYFPRS
jgi:microsomal epoxide hydrolase